MLEELFNLVKGSAGDAVINNPDVPEEHNNEVMAEATNTVASGLRNMVAGGGLESILSLFGNKDAQQGNNGGLLKNPIVNMMIGHFAGKLMSRFNLGGNQANNVANSLIPNVISGLVNKTNDPENNNFSIEKILNSITGGKVDEVQQAQSTDSGSGFNLQHLISQFTGGGQSAGNGGSGLMNIISQFAGGAQTQ